MLVMPNYLDFKPALRSEWPMTGEISHIDQKLLIQRHHVPPEH